MESPIEKPFKCTTCSQGFTNEDHLQVHRKRHDMSLNLGLLNGNGTQQSEGFTDQTPTPTRFFRISEEVGFFQDIQNVNPFDEQFAKAASESSTPSIENQNFDFTFSQSCTNDTLNTPQVLGFPPSTPLPLVAQIQNQNLCDLRNKKTKPAPEIVGEVESTCETATVRDSPIEESQNFSTSEITDSSVHSLDKRTELLERNRAAAVRSRQRRKQWVSELETKNNNLTALLKQAHSELRTVRAENFTLREELQSHSNCNVTKGTQSSPKSPTPSLAFQPSILRSPGSISVLSKSVKDTSFPLPPPPVPTKIKRGRPKKGEEKRATFMLPPTVGPPFKVQILPLHPLRTFQTSSVIVLNRASNNS